jgi:hypothetical protein
VPVARESVGWRQFLRPVSWLTGFGAPALVRVVAAERGSRRA